MGSRERQAYGFWVLHRLVDVWCAMRQAAINAEELRIVGMRRYRRMLLRHCFCAWALHHQRIATANAACTRARARLATTYSRMLLYRLGLCVFSMLVELMQDDVDSARYSLERGTLKRCVMHWRNVTSEAQLRQKYLACHCHAKCLSASAFRCWFSGIQQVRLEQELEAHKNALREKVSCWLHELDSLPSFTKKK